MANVNDILKQLGIAPQENEAPLMLQEAVIPQPVVAQAPVVSAPELSPKQQYIAENTIPSRTITGPGRPNFEESKQERDDRIAREQALNDRLTKSKSDYDDALKSASDREFKANLWATLGNYAPGIIAGATAMNTKAAVKPADVPKITVEDLKSREDTKYKTDYEKIINQYKQLSSGQLTPAKRAQLEAQYDQMDLTRQAIQGNMDFRGEAQKDKTAEAIEKKVENFGKATESNAKALNNLNQIDEVLSSSGIPSIDSLKVKDNKVLDANGKEVDLPGLSVMGLGRVTIGNDKAQTFEDTMARVFNIELKDRSGAAVTTPELQNLRAEFGKGKFNTESQMVSALQRYKKAAAEALRQAEARYETAVVDEAKTRGMTTSDSFAPKGQPAGKTVVKTEVNKKTGQKRLTYSDGTVEVQ